MIIKFTNKDGEEKQYNIADWLYNQLMKIEKLILTKDRDYIIVIDGEEGCLSGDTQIQISRGKLSRRFSIKRLYNHYNGNPDKIIQKNKSFDLSIPSFARSFNGKETIYLG